jgi:hypothetical protein
MNTLMLLKYVRLYAISDGKWRKLLSMHAVLKFRTLNAHIVLSACTNVLESALVRLHTNLFFTVYVFGLGLGLSM